MPTQFLGSFGRKRQSSFDSRGILQALSQGLSLGQRAKAMKQRQEEFNARQKASEASNLLQARRLALTEQQIEQHQAEFQWRKEQAELKQAQEQNLIRYNNLLRQREAVAKEVATSGKDKKKSETTYKQASVTDVEGNLAGAIEQVGNTINATQQILMSHVKPEAKVEPLVNEEFLKQLNETHERAKQAKENLKRLKKTYGDTSSAYKTDLEKQKELKQQIAEVGDQLTTKQINAMETLRHQSRIRHEQEKQVFMQNAGITPDVMREVFDQVLRIKDPKKRQGFVVNSMQRLYDAVKGSPYEKEIMTSFANKANILLPIEPKGKASKPLTMTQHVTAARTSPQGTIGAKLSGLLDEADELAGKDLIEDATVMYQGKPWTSQQLQTEIARQSKAGNLGKPFVTAEEKSARKRQRALSQWNKKGKAGVKNLKNYVGNLAVNLRGKGDGQITTTYHQINKELEEAGVSEQVRKTLMDYFNETVQGVVNTEIEDAKKLKPHPLTSSAAAGIAYF